MQKENLDLIKLLTFITLNERQPNEFRNEIIYIQQVRIIIGHCLLFYLFRKHSQEWIEKTCWDWRLALWFCKLLLILITLILDPTGWWRPIILARSVHLSYYSGSGHNYGNPCMLSQAVELIKLKVFSATNNGDPKLRRQ